MYELRKHQAQILSELDHLSSIALYMGTGTGKTITAIDKFKRLPVNKLLIICPHSVINQWKDNIKEHLPDLRILDFKVSWSSDKKEAHLKEMIDEIDAIVINFETIYRIPFFNKFIDDNWFIVVDEIHRIKNWGTQRKPIKATRFIVNLGDLTPYKVGLTATPTQGNFGGYIDYYPQLKFLGYTDLNYYKFFDQYVLYETKNYNTTPYPIKQIVGYKNKKEIDEILKLMARRYQPIYGDFEPVHNRIKFDRVRGYTKMLSDKALQKNESVIMLNNSARKRLAAKTMTTGTVLGKNQFNTDEVIDHNKVKLNWLEDFLQDTQDVVAIFYMYNVELENLKELMIKLKKKFIIINGKTKDKTELIKKGGYDVVIGQYKALAESIDGLHLHCHIEVFFSMPESSLLYKQALGRIDRDGQIKVPMYYYLIMEKTIDQTIMEMIDKKIEFSEQTLEKLEIGEV